ncbi:hypothetical protein ACSAZL_03630 [Methanosarcina sp. T3]
MGRLKPDRSEIKGEEGSGGRIQGKAVGTSGRGKQKTKVER